MTQLFDRRYRLQVDTLSIDGLNIAFTIERTLRRRPGRAEVKVWNLSQTHRRELEQLQAGHVFVELHLGYRDGALTRVFRGELHRARSERSGPEWITTIASRDGGGASSSRTSRSYAAGASLAAVVRGVAGDMDVDEGNLEDELGTASIDGVGSTFAAGATVVGSAPEELDGLLASAGREWSIQDGALQVLPRGRALQRTAIRLAPETGLLESPTRDEHGRVLCKTLVIPDLVPGVLVHIESQLHTGTFRVEQATYKGEYDGTEWGLELVCAEPHAPARAA